MATRSVSGAVGATRNSISTALQTRPVTVGVDGLSELLHRTPATILADRCRRPESLPPACVPPGTRQPIWITADVLKWLAQHSEPMPASKLGRPAKSKQMERTSADCGVRDAH